MIMFKQILQAYYNQLEEGNNELLSYLVVGELERVGVKVPDDDCVVLAAGGQELPVRRPLYSVYTT
jgi:hypothetical protein